MAVALEGRFRHVERAGQHVVEFLRAAFGLAGFRQVEQLQLGALDLVDRRVVEVVDVGFVDDLLAEVDQLPAQIQVVDRRGRNRRR